MAITSFDLANVVPNFHHKEKTMTGIPSLVILLLAITLAVGGCQFLQLLAAPTGANAGAARHNEEGIDAYKKKQWIPAREHFEAAIQASPTLGMVLYQMGADGEARPHLMKAANLAPGNSVIWSSPAFSNVQAPSGSNTSAGGFSDGHGHSH